MSFLVFWLFLFVSNCPFARYEGQCNTIVDMGSWSMLFLQQMYAEYFFH